MGIIFDFNGTMIFDGFLHDKAWKSIAMQLKGTTLNDEELQHHIHGVVNEKIIQYLIGNVDTKQNKHLSLYKEHLYREMVEIYELSLVNGLPEFLDYLKNKGIKMTIASASIKENIDFFYDFFNLSRWFKKEDIIFDDGTHENKVTMFQKAANILDVPIEECIVFEDSKSGIQFAEDAGVKTIIGVKSDKNDKIALMTIQDFADPAIYKLINKGEIL